MGERARRSSAWTIVEGVIDTRLLSRGESRHRQHLIRRVLEKSSCTTRRIAGSSLPTPRSPCCPTTAERRAGPRRLAVGERSKRKADLVTSCAKLAGAFGERGLLDPLEVVEGGDAFDSGGPQPRRGGSRCGMSRIVRLTGATTMPVRTGKASDRVTTSTGRRLSSLSAHQISPCLGMLTTVLRRSAHAWPRRGRRARSGVCGRRR